MQAIDKETDKLPPFVCFDDRATGNKVQKVCHWRHNNVLRPIWNGNAACIYIYISYVERALEYIFHRYKREWHEKENVPARSVVPCGLTGREDLYWPNFNVTYWMFPHHLSSLYLKTPHLSKGFLWAVSRWTYKIFFNEYVKHSILHIRLSLNKKIEGRVKKNTVFQTKVML